MSHPELKEKEKSSEGSAKDGPNHAVITVAPLQTDTDKEASSKLGSLQATTNDESGSIDQSQATTSVVVSRPRAATVGALPSGKESVDKHNVSSTKSSSLRQNLDKIMASLDTKRKSAERPDDMTVRDLISIYFFFYCID